MQRASHSPSSVFWRPDAAPKTACVMQAVLGCAAVSVIFQSVINLWLSTSAFVLQLGMFLVALPLAWRLLVTGDHPPSKRAVFDRVCFSAHGISGEFDHSDERVSLQVMEVRRFWATMQLKLAPLGAVRRGVAPGIGKPAVNAGAKPIVITIWKSDVGLEKFRRIAIMAHWHARRLA